jgi:hypothetical protein
MMHPTFATRAVLERVTGIRVIGTVSAALRAGREPWYRRQGLLVGGAVAMLFVAFFVNQVAAEPLRAAVRSLSAFGA